jgi:23S rRNA pseudouridine1911/1915/1917 synthase
MTKSDPEPQAITLQSRIPNDAKGLRLLDFLAQRFRYLNRDGWRTELADDRIALDGISASGDEVLRGGMKLRYEKMHREPQVSLDFRVVHQDTALLAVDKPSHLPMHADGPFIRNTLIHQLREEHGEQLQLVHRLDRETSGICIVATNKVAQAAVQAQFSANGDPNSVRKVYLAVVHGRLEHALRCEQPIGHKFGREVTLRRSAADDAENPKAASTTLEPVRYGPNKTLVRCLPETGRTHQIRVHLEQAGHPVVGDKLYGHPDSHYLAFVARMKAGESVFEDTAEAPNRHLLHAHKIYLRHPNDDSEQCYEAPIPEEFERWLLS